MKRKGRGQESFTRMCAFTSARMNTKYEEDKPEMQKAEAE
jgi:hypothetical protein